MRFQTGGIVGRHDPAEFRALTIEEAEQFALQCAAGNEKDFLAYLPEIIPIAEEVEREKGCAYNSEVERLAHERLFPHLPEDLDGAHQSKYLSLLVYNTSCYRSSLKMYQEQEAFERSMVEEGFTQVEDVNAVKTGERYFVAEPLRPKPERLLARQFGNSVLWSTRSNSRTGFYAQQGQWIKPVTLNAS